MRYRINYLAVSNTNPLTILSPVQISDDESRDSLLHYAGKVSSEGVGMFLVSQGAKVTPLNRAGETPLHCSATNGVTQLTRALIEVSNN